MIVDADVKNIFTYLDKHDKPGLFRTDTAYNEFIDYVTRILNTVVHNVNNGADHGTFYVKGDTQRMYGHLVDNFQQINFALNIFLPAHKINNITLSYGEQVSPGVISVDHYLYVISYCTKGIEDLVDGNIS